MLQPWVKAVDIYCSVNIGNAPRQSNKLSLVGKYLYGNETFHGLRGNARNMSHCTKSYPLTSNLSCRVGSCCFWFKFSITCLLPWNSPTTQHERTKPKVSTTQAVVKETLSGPTKYSQSGVCYSECSCTCFLAFLTWKPRFVFSDSGLLCLNLLRRLRQGLKT